MEEFERVKVEAREAFRQWQVLRVRTEKNLRRALYLLLLLEKERGERQQEKTLHLPE